jgi:menaquinol-cytochrome c reductase iron-sulfur subunit
MLMAKEGSRSDPSASDPSLPTETESPDRRQFLNTASRTAMVAGVVGGYGGFALIAGKYLYPASTGEVMWQFVSEVEGIQVGESIRYRGPSGETINIARMSRDGTADDFIALSSTCPHLGCQVRWEGQNNRFFCPCHNGVFDPSGQGVSGPPGDAGQSLPRYELRVENGLLHIAVPPPRFASAEDRSGIITHDDAVVGPGHDPCLGCEGDRPGGDGDGELV